MFCFASISTAATREGKFIPFNARYWIGEEIGKGGMGLVYRGWDLQLQRQVAIKIIRQDHQRNQQHLLRFLREARIASQLRHPSILGIHDFDVEPSGSAYIIMDLITGRTMEQVIADTIVEESKRHSMLSTFFADLSGYGLCACQRSCPPRFKNQRTSWLVTMVSQPFWIGERCELFGRASNGIFRIRTAPNRLCPSRRSAGHHQ